MKKAYLILTILSGAIMGSCSKNTDQKNNQKEEISVVETSNVIRKTLGESIETAGVLSSKSEIKLAFKTGGLIKRVYVNEGQMVKAGQLLAELDLAEIDAQVNQAKIGLQKAKRDYERVKNLYEDEAATQTNLLDANSGLDLATQSMQAAVFNQKLSKIYAPVSGRVLRKISEQGELITPFAPAFILGTGSQSAFIVNVGVADKEVVKLKVGNNAIVYLDAYPDENFKATVSQIAQSVNPATGTYEIELQMSPNSKNMISGFVARAVIQPVNKNSSLVMPISGLVDANESDATVFVLEGTIAKKRNIKIGKIKGEEIEVLIGLKENEQIITKGGGFLVEGQKVKVINN